MQLKREPEPWERIILRVASALDRLEAEVHHATENTDRVLTATEELLEVVRKMEERERWVDHYRENVPRLPIV